MKSTIAEKLAGQDIGFISVCIYIAMVSTVLLASSAISVSRTSGVKIAIASGYVLAWAAFVTYLGLAGRRVSDRISEKSVGIGVVVGTIVILYSVVGLLMAGRGVLSHLIWVDIVFIPAYLIEFYLLVLIKRRFHTRLFLVLLGLAGTLAGAWAMKG